MDQRQDKLHFCRIVYVILLEGGKTNELVDIEKCAVTHSEENKFPGDPLHEIPHKGYESIITSIDLLSG